MTLAEFATIFALLAVQLRSTDADETVLRAYYEGLEDLEQSRGGTIGSPVGGVSENDWRDTAKGIRRERLESQRARLRSMPRPACSVCDDTGRQPVDVVENEEPVRRVTPCACRTQRRLEILGHVSQSP